MIFIIGLGNPGLEYRLTKHNIGFMVVKGLAKENGIKINKKLHFSLVGRGKIGDEDVAFILPQTYMNLSGKAIGELFTKEIKDIGSLLVVCDDINLELGKIRLKKQGSSGGHKGLESIAQTLGRDDFARLRVGIATDVHRGDITRYVLSPFKRKEMRNVSHAVSLAADAITCMVGHGIDKAMTKFNKRKVGTS
ncbi:MAG: aminoacyl-tRNA hydrolase [Candidatus Omnitrophota bacterium]|nr:aminoacyl-tRNA hydrolase [Candidatus Omnitrophota bacterium]